MIINPTGSDTGCKTCTETFLLKFSHGLFESKCALFCLLYAYVSQLSRDPFKLTLSELYIFLGNGC